MISGQSCNVCFIKIQTTVHTYTVIVTVLWLFLANSNFILQISHAKSFKKWGVRGAATSILSKDIHNYILCEVRILMKQTLFKKERLQFYLLIVRPEGEKTQQVK